MDKDQGKKQSFSTNNVKSSILKMGAKTIFFDVNLAANDKKYFLAFLISDLRNSFGRSSSSQNLTLFLEYKKRPSVSVFLQSL